MVKTLVTGGAGFLGSRVCDRLIERGDDALGVDNFFTGDKANVVQLFGHPRFELMRQDVTFHSMSRSTASTISPARQSGPLPARSGADDQDQRPRRDQHAGPGEAASAMSTT